MSIKVERMRNAYSKIITLNIVFNTNNFFPKFFNPMRYSLNFFSICIFEDFFPELAASPEIARSFLFVNQCKYAPALAQ